MKVKELGNCVRPVIFENEEHDAFPYTVGGTCFFIEYRNRLFAVTAKHVLKNNRYEAKDVRIPPSFNNMTHFLPISKCFGNSVYESDRQDYADVLLLEIAKDKLHSDWIDQLESYSFEEKTNISLEFY